MLFWCPQAVLRNAAKTNQNEVVRQVSEEEHAFCDMILRQDDSQRTLEEKWADLRMHLSGSGSQKFRCVHWSLHKQITVYTWHRVLFIESNTRQ